MPRRKVSSWPSSVSGWLICQSIHYYTHSRIYVYLYQEACDQMPNQAPGTFTYRKVIPRKEFSSPQEAHTVHCWERESCSSQLGKGNCLYKQHLNCVPFEDNWAIVIVYLKSLSRFTYIHLHQDYTPPACPAFFAAVLPNSTFHLFGFSLSPHLSILSTRYRVSLSFDASDASAYEMGQLMSLRITTSTQAS